MSGAGVPELGHSGARRLLWIDIARTIALLAMAIFHFVRDLEFFGVIPLGTTVSGGWAVFARAIAGAFLFLSGISLIVAHGHGQRFDSWLRRLLTIAGAALAVTIISYLSFPGRFIYFGILHAIVVAGLLGFVLRRASAGLLLGAATAILVVNATYSRAFDLSPFWAWTGLSENVLPSLDFIPIVPWLFPYLAGMAFAKCWNPSVLEPRWPTEFRANRLAWPGQHSLAIYLLHQPVMISAAWLISKAAS